MRKINYKGSLNNAIFTLKEKWHELNLKIQTIVTNSPYYKKLKERIKEYEKAIEILEEREK